MGLRHNPDSFLTGDDPFLPVRTLESTRGRVDQELVFETRHEGFIGIPHGGLPMGFCLDAWRRIGPPSYPVQARYKFGGSGVAIGDSLIFSVERDPEGSNPHITAKITKPGDKTPYLRAEIGPAASEPADVIPRQPSEDFRGLPYYRNCFVCGHHRTERGLKRRFRLHDSEGNPVVTTPWRASSVDGDRAELFLIEKEELHPAVLISVFDENTAWAGFMLTRACGLSVRLQFTLMRPVKVSEDLLFVGRPVAVRGNPRAPRFFIAEGAILAMTDPRNPEPVAYGRGEWIVMNQYTEQIKKNLLPDDDWQWIFGDEEK